MNKSIRSALSLGVGLALVGAIAAAAPAQAATSTGVPPEVATAQASSVKSAAAQDSAAQDPAGQDPAGESYPVSGAVIGGLLYTRVQIDSKDGSGEKFVGNGGGVFTPGAGAFLGDLYTNDLARLYSDTTNFQVNATPVYTNINFFDSDANLLGSLHAGSVSTVVGVGGGTGNWSI
ncbi:VapA/VapB family virulence-associated protein [Luethyella okanaganae]|uniref:VapA/VapB family virulence-associated protein n=1 Tax=Luethyella okanaganae TaxID=69372 RepID=A0ABW1VIP1_9MICO